MVEIITVFLMGLGVIIHPCTIAPTIAALTFISQSKQHASLSMVLFVVGHTLAYIILSTILVILARKTVLFTSLQEHDAWGHYLLMGIFFLAGLWLIWSSFRSHHHHGKKLNVLTTPLGAFVSGIGIAYLFCPEFAFVFFGMVIPSAITSSMGMWILLSFSLGTALPLLALCWGLSAGKQQLMSRWNISQVLVNRVLGVIFILSAIVMLVF